MAEGATRAYVVHDSSPWDPRDWDNACDMETYDHTSLAYQRLKERKAYLVSRTSGYQSAEEMAFAAGVEPPDLYDPETLDAWLTVACNELLIREVTTQYSTLVAITTPESLKVLGCDWADAERIADAELETFKHYVEGEVYGYIIEQQMSDDDNDWQEIDSCYGFYGPDPKENGLLDAVGPEHAHQIDMCEVVYRY